MGNLAYYARIGGPKRPIASDDIATRKNGSRSRSRIRPGLAGRFYVVCRHWRKRASRQDELLWSALRFQALFNSGMLREAKRAFRPGRARPRRLDVPK